jgi:EmrB/QacA subfamily drug resistance transporter
MTPSPDLIYRRRWWTLGVLSLSLLVIGLDNTILNVALPSLRADLHASSSQLQWIVDAYLLVFAGILLTAGGLGDRFGRKKALVAGLVVFGGGSCASAFAGSASALISTRALMGLGAALIMPSTLSILTNVFPARERARAIAIWAGVSGLGIAIGPITGGWLLDHFSWGSVFLVNVPFVLGTLIAARSLVPESRDPAAAPLDYVGAALSIVALVSLTWGIIEAPSKGWTALPILAAYAVSAAFAAAFVAWELRTAHPLLEISFFRNRSFSAASASIALVFFALMGVIFYLTQYIQSVLGYSPLQAGIRIVPIAAGLMVAAGNAPRLVAKLGVRRMIAIGLATVAGSLLLLSQATVNSGYWLVAVVLLTMGIGMGLAMAPATDSVMGSLPLEKASVGSAMNDTTRMVGGALGVAVLGSILQSGYSSHIGSAAPAAARDSLGGALQVGGAQLVEHARHAFVSGMSTASLVAAAIAFAGAIIAFVALPKVQQEHADVVELRRAAVPAPETIAA